MSETILGVSKDGVMFCPRDPEIPKAQKCWICNKKRAKYAAVRFTGQEIKLCIRCALVQADSASALKPWY